ncbi:NACHT domain-containing protein [Actinomadura miaoliensis]|uniref:NACHT domain-containing protein n=1 Tax=Actinomadura miaoliensis TaxID=430685 RepID=UPI0031ECC7BA
MAGYRSGWWRSLGATALGVLILTISIGLVVVLRRSGLQTAANWAQLASIPLAVVPLVPSVVAGWRRAGRDARTSTPEQLDRARETLAGLVSEQWREEIRVRRLDDPAPMAVRWRLTELPVMDHSAHVVRARRFPFGADRPRLDGRSDRVADLVRAYRDLPRRRLVILGEPGMGKTTLAVLLLRRLLQERRPGERVPVMVSLSGWDPGAVSFDEWLAGRLTETYPALRATAFGPDAPRALVRERRVLPVLDGLDELPEPSRPKVISALNEALTEDDPVILTCRTAEYEAAVNAPGGDVLTAGAVVEPRPLRPADIAAYVTHSLPPRPCGAWPDLLAALAAGERTPLTRALATPLALWLLRKVYVDTRTDPAPLLDASRFTGPGAIVDHLLDDLVDALVPANRDARDEGRPSRPRRAHRPEDVRRWLSYLALHLRAAGTTDIAWWHLPGMLPRRTVDNLTALAVGLPAGVTLALTNLVIFGISDKLGNALAYGPAFVVMHRVFTWRPARATAGRRDQCLRRAAQWLVGGLLFALTCGFGDALTDGLRDGLSDGLTIGLADGLGVGLAYGLATGFFGAGGPDAEPVHADFRLRGRARSLLRHVAIWFAGGLLLGPAVGLVDVLAGALGNEAVYVVTDGLTDQSRMYYALSITFGLTFGVGLGIRNWSRVPQATGPPQTPRQSLRRDLLVACLEAHTLGLAVGLAFGLATGMVAGPVNGVSYGLLFGLTFALMIGLRSCSGTYLVALLYLRSRRMAPLRLMRFLEDAHRLGLLRQTGTVHQFRNAKLQDRLAAHHTSGAGRPPVSPRPRHVAPHGAPRRRARRE